MHRSGLRTRSLWWAALDYTKVYTQHATHKTGLDAEVYTTMQVLGNTDRHMF